MTCFSDWILLFRLMQNQMNSQMTLSLAPTGWGIHTSLCQHRHAHPWGIPPSRGKWLYHLCHPSGSGADPANPLHVFNIAHAKPWSHASIPQVSPTDVCAAAAATAGSILTPGWTSPLQQPARPSCACSPTLASPGSSERDVTALASKNSTPSSSLTLPQPCQADHHLPGALQQDIMVSVNGMGGLHCVRLSPWRGSHSCQCDELTGKDRQHQSITPLIAWNAAISLVESNSQANKLRGAVSEQTSSVTELLLRESPTVVPVCPEQLPPVLPPGVRNKYESWRD